MTLTDEEVIRFWSKVDKNGPVPQSNPDLGPCWVWTTGLRCGYGAFAINRKNKGAHKLSFLMSGGVTTPERPFVLHSCHNRACVNPAHLRAGNQQENIDDMVGAGRQCKGEEKSRLAKLVAPRGDNHPSRLHPECLRRGNNHPAHLHPENQPRGEENKNSKLTDSKVRDIRARCSANVISQRKLAKEFGVHQTVIGDILRNKTWRHVV